MKKYYDGPDIDKGPHLTPDELLEIEEFAQRRNDDLIEKLLKDRLYWIRSCAHSHSRLMLAISTGLTWSSKREEGRRSGWARINCWAESHEAYMAALPRPTAREEPQPIGFDLSARAALPATVVSAETRERKTDEQ